MRVLEGGEGERGISKVKALDKMYASNIGFSFGFEVIIVC